jgi:hypothetical protein
MTVLPESSSWVCGHSSDDGVSDLPHLGLGQCPVDRLKSQTMGDRPTSLLNARSPVHVEEFKGDQQRACRCSDGGPQHGCGNGIG